MIIQRLTIRNYRGVEEASVEFSPVGITLIEGDNEVGKSSLIEALHNIFEYADDSGHRNIKAVRPTHRDKGPEIELEAEAGPYHFTYFKRYHRKPATELTVTAPEVENLTGRQAHERAEEILDETIDRPLWKAVGVQQGEGISQAKLKEAGSLTAALNRAAGGDVAGREENTLFDDIEKEYRKYFTGTGRDGKEIESARVNEEELEKQLTELKRQILEVEKDTERAGSLKDEIRNFEGTITTLKAEVRDSRENLAKVEKLEEEINTHELELGNLDRDCTAARRDLEDREAIIRKIAETRDQAKKIAGELGDTEKKLVEAESAVIRAGELRKEAGESLKGARSVRDLRQKDHDYYRNLLFLDQMEERKSRVDKARKDAKGAGAVLEKIRITEKVLDEILEIEKARDSAIAQLQVGAPSLTMSALKSVDIKVDGKAAKMKSGQEDQRSVTDEINILIPDVLEITVAPGTSSEGLGRQLHETEEKLSQILKTNGVTDSSDAKRQLQTREKAELQIEEVEEVEEQNLRDLTYEELTGRIQGLRELTGNYLENRGEGPQIAGDQDSARDAQEEAEDILKKAERGYEKADDSFRAAEEIRNRLKEGTAGTKGHAEKLATDLENMEKDLKEARKGISDKVLEEKVGETIKIAEEKRGVIGLKKEELSHLNPEQVRALVETSEGSLDSSNARLRNLELEQAGLESRLRALGEEGLHEKIQKVEGDLFRRQRENRSLFRRAAAAELLFKTMKKERDEAYESYKAPFKDKIEQLGRLVHNDSFQVLLNDDLSIEERVLDGIKVPFESLSGGAREQVSILARIAAAILVSEDNAVPIIIDDALGYTSPGRLKYMGAVIARAGKTGQVIVLTCTPERYAHLGEVKSVSLD
jgi:DNA repair exonuclease SbcCD ATPase subunit